MAEGGYDYEIVGETFDDFFCQICLKLMKDAVQLECGHGMCNACLNGMIDGANKGHIQLSCLKCRKCIILEKVVPASLLNQVILCVKVKCENLQAGCEWVEKIGDMKDHLLKICDYEAVSCPHCNKQMIRLNYGEHKKTCVYRIVLCKHCKYSCQYRLMSEHFKTCKKFPLECPNKCGGELILQSEIVDHLLHHCSHVLVHCDFLSSGCEVKEKRMDLKNHMEVSMEHHLILLMKENMETKSTMAILQEDNNSLKLHYSKLENDLSIGLEICKKELSSAKDTIFQVKQHLLRLETELKEMKYLQKNRDGYYLDWIENQITDKLNTIFTDLINRFIGITTNIKPEIVQIASDFDTNCCIFQSKLEDLSLHINSKVNTATSEMNSLRLPWFNFDVQLFIKNTIQELKNNFPIHKDIWESFEESKERLNRIKTSLTANDYKLTQLFSSVSNMKSFAIYENRIKGLLNILNQQPLKEAGMYCLSAKVIDHIIEQSEESITIQLGDRLVMLDGQFDIKKVNSYPILKLQNQYQQNHIFMVKNVKGVYCLEESFDELIKKAFLVDNTIIIFADTALDVCDSKDQLFNPVDNIDACKYNVIQVLTSILTAELKINRVVSNFFIFSRKLQNMVKEFDQNCILLEDGIEELKCAITNEVKAFDEELQHPLGMILLFDPYVHYAYHLQQLISQDSIPAEFAAMMETNYTKDEICTNILQKYTIELCKIKSLSKEIEILVSKVNYSDRFTAMLDLVQDYKCSWGKNQLQVIYKIDMTNGDDREEMVTVKTEDNKLIVCRAMKMFHEYSGGISIRLRNKNSFDDEFELLLDTHGRFSSNYELSSLTELGYINSSGLLVLKIIAMELTGLVIQNGCEWLTNYTTKMVRKKGKTEFENILKEKMKRLKLEITWEIKKFDANYNLVHNGLTLFKSFVQTKIDTFQQVVTKLFKDVNVTNIEAVFTKITFVTPIMLEIVKESFHINVAEDEYQQSQNELLLLQMKWVNYEERFIKMLQAKKMILKETYAFFRCTLPSNGYDDYRNGWYIERLNERFYVDGLSTLFQECVGNKYVQLCSHKKENVFLAAKYRHHEFVVDLSVKEIIASGFMVKDTIVVKVGLLDNIAPAPTLVKQMNFAYVEDIRKEIHLQSRKTKREVTTHVNESDKHLIILSGFAEFEKYLKEKLKTDIDLVRPKGMLLDSFDSNNPNTKLTQQVACVKASLSSRVRNIEEMRKLAKYSTRFKVLLTRTLNTFHEIYRNKDCSMVAIKCKADLGYKEHYQFSIHISLDQIKIAMTPEAFAGNSNLSIVSHFRNESIEAKKKSDSLVFHISLEELEQGKFIVNNVFVITMH